MFNAQANKMKTRSELFLWIHLGGIIMFPLFLLITVIGLAVGESYSYLIEVPLLVAISIVPILLMQLYRPFNIFSVLLFSLKPELLTASQKKILALFQRKQQKFANVIAAVLMLLSLWLLYYLSSGVGDLVSFFPPQRSLGLVIAVIAFLGSNLFLQIPLSALQALLTDQAKLSQTEQCSLEEIEAGFTTPGIKIGKMPWFSKSTLETEELN